ncbi:hypothetical protein [Phytoactinopolyspora halophila]|nr:hypothetical protein [Phytoactinopolyspora halophila]
MREEELSEQRRADIERGRRQMVLAILGAAAVGVLLTAVFAAGAVLFVD